MEELNDLHLFQCQKNEWSKRRKGHRWCAPSCWNNNTAIYDEKYDKPIRHNMRNDHTSDQSVLSVILILPSKFDFSMCKVFLRAYLIEYI